MPASTSAEPRRRHRRKKRKWLALVQRVFRFRWRLDRRALLRLAFVTPVLAWLAWESAVATMSRWDPDTESPPALAAPPGEAEALAGTAAKQLDDATAPGDLPAVEELSREALALKPIATEPIRLLALAAQRRGDAARAALLMGLAERRSRRNPLVENWLFDRSVAAGDFAAALPRADSLLRTSTGAAHDRALAALAGVAGDERAVRPLADLLAASPPWRSAFLSVLLANPDRLEASRRLIAAMSTTNGPVTPDELSDYLAALVGQGRFEAAYLAWVASLSDDQSKEVAYVYNGGFEQQPGQSPFDWVFADEHVAEVAIAASPPPAGGQALRVEFADRRVAKPLAWKLLVLPPGSYRLSGKAKLDDIVNERGLWWTIACANGDKSLLGTTERISGNLPWQDMEAHFQVPDSCNGQWLRLEVAARVALEQQISGVAWFDDLAITREEHTAGE